MPATDFTHRDLRAVGKRVHRLGLALNYGLDEAGVEAALERGVNDVYWTQLLSGAVKRPVRDALRKHRENMVIATQPTLGFFRGGVRLGLENALRTLGVETIDVFQLGWLGVASAWTEGTVDELVKLRDEGKVRAIGVSLHDRPRAGRLAEESPLDLFMLRYNAAHPGAEREVFPHLAKRRPSVVAYTATSWRRLLERPGGWSGPVMTAGDCYRFCLSNEHVDLVLCGPGSRAQLEENLAAIERGPLAPDELGWMRSFGKAVHG